MEMETLRDLYVDELKDLYSAEKQLVKALGKMARLASAPKLQEAFRNHLEETETHVERLEEIFDSLEASPRGKKCVGMEGLIEEANELAEEDAQEDVLDAGLISKAQHVEHYEMAGYGTVRTYALTLGEAKHADLLQRTLDEEMKADKLLTQLAEASVNIDATIGDEANAGSRPGRTASDREVSRSVASEGRRGGAKSSSKRSTGSGRSSMKETRAR